MLFVYDYTYHKSLIVSICDVMYICAIINENIQDNCMFAPNGVICNKKSDGDNGLWSPYIYRDVFEKRTWLFRQSGDPTKICVERIMLHYKCLKRPNTLCMRFTFWNSRARVIGFFHREKWGGGDFDSVGRGGGDVVCEEERKRWWEKDSWHIMWIEAGVAVVVRERMWGGQFWRR